MESIRNPGLYIIGCGGHAKSVIDALTRTGQRILGAVDINPEKHGQRVMAVEILGHDDIILKHDPGTVLLVNGVGSVSDPTDRREVFERFKGLGYSFISVIHPSAMTATHVEVGEGSQVMAGTVIQPKNHIGANCIINTSASIDHDCVIGDHVHVAPGATLCGFVTVGNGAHIGAGATVIQGLAIGAGAIVGAGAAVLEDVAPGTIVAGVPARRIS